MSNNITTGSSSDIKDFFDIIHSIRLYEKDLNILLGAKYKNLSHSIEESQYSKHLSLSRDYLKKERRLLDI